MSEIKNTPWISHETRVYLSDLAGGFDVRDCPNPEEIARLCAAAPELLEALKAVVSVADRATVEFDMARAAIEKATQS